MALDAVALNPSRLLPGGSYLYSNVPYAFPAPGPDDDWTPLAVALNEGHAEMAALIRQLLGQ